MKMIGIREWIQAKHQNDLKNEKNQENAVKMISIRLKPV
jgi:hypothetical protein